MSNVVWVTPWRRAFRDNGIYPVPVLGCKVACKVDSFSALTLLIRRQEGHQACKKNLAPAFSRVRLCGTWHNLEWSPDNRPVKQKKRIAVIVR